MSFLHGLKLIEETGGARVLPLQFSSVIGICGTSEDADATKYPLDTSVICSSEADLALLGEGWLFEQVEMIFKKFKTRCLVSRVASGADAAAKLVNITGELAEKTGIYSFLDAKSNTGYAPGLIISELSEESGVSAAMKVVEARLLATGIILAPDAFTVETTEYEGKEAAKKYEDSLADKNAYVVWPSKIKVSASKEIDACGAVAALFAHTDYNEGQWTSPSNHVLDFVFGTNPAIDFELTDASCTANELNENDVNTIVRESGFRLWGNHTAAGSADEKWRFVSVKRMSDMIKKTIKEGILWAVDKGITKTFVEDVVESVNGVLRDLKGAGGILGGECWAEDEINPVTNIKTGKIAFKYKFGPVYPAQEISFIEVVTDEYISEIFG